LRGLARPALLLLPALAGGLLVLWATPLGSGTEQDSAAYICAAQSFVARGAISGCGTIWPMTHFMPFYAVLLALPGFFGASPLTVAPWIGALSCTASVLLVGTILYRATSSVVIALFGESLFLSARDAISVQLYAMSEAPFIVLMLLFVLALWHSVEDDRRGWVIAAGLGAAGACLTRYMGASLLITGASTLAWMGPPSLRTRVSRALLFLMVGGIPFGAWLTRNWYENGDTIGRPLHWHPPGKAELMRGCVSVAHWIFPWVPSERGHAIGLAIVAGLSIWLVFIIWKNTNPLAWLLANLVIANGALILVCRYVSDPYISLSDRMLAPMLVASLILTLVEIDFIATNLGPDNNIRTIGIALGLGFVMSTAPAAAEVLHRSRTEGLEYTALAYADSRMMNWLRQLPTGTIIYTDEPELVSMFANRSCLILPLMRDPLTNRPPKTLASELAQMQGSMTTEPGYIAYFFKAKPYRYNNIPVPQDMAAAYRLSLTPVLETPEGIIFEARSTNLPAVPSDGLTISHTR
jgi:hypothetical protein